jgi:hypothetical protein
MQLPDIIKKQEGLGEKMKDGMKKGDKGEGQKGQNGKQGKTGQSGQEGEVVKGCTSYLEIYKSKSNYVALQKN